MSQVAELHCEDTIILTSMNFLQDILSSGTIHCMGCGLHEDSSASHFPLVEYISLNHKMLFHYHWFLSICLVFLMTRTQTQKLCFCYFHSTFVLTHSENIQMQQVYKK